MSRDILLGAVIGAHGLKGEVRVRTFTETPEKLGAYGPLHGRDGRSFVVTAVRGSKPGEAVVTFGGVSDREAAAALKGVELFVARVALPAAAQDEFYHDDLIGLRAEDDEGHVLGTVRAVHNFGAGDVLEIVRSDDDTVFLPFTRDVVPVVDFEGGRIVVVVPEDVEATKKGFIE